MSEWEYIEMAAFDRRDPRARQVFRGRLRHVPGLLAESPLAEQAPERLKGELKHLNATARNSHFQNDCKELFDAMGTVDSLRFFSGERCTYSMFWNNESVDGRSVITSDEKDKIDGCGFSWGTLTFYSAFDRIQCERVIADIDHFLQWSMDYPEKVALPFKWINCGWDRPCTEEAIRDILAEIKAAPVYDNPRAGKYYYTEVDGCIEVGHDAYGVNFLYRMIKSTRRLMEYATCAGLDVAYVNTIPNGNFSYWAWLIGLKRHASDT